MFILWAGILLPPIAFLLNLQINYSLVPWVCVTGRAVAFHLASEHRDRCSCRIRRLRFVDPMAKDAGRPRPFYGCLGLDNERAVSDRDHRPSRCDVYLGTMPEMMILLHAGRAIEPHDLDGVGLRARRGDQPRSNSCCVRQGNGAWRPLGGGTMSFRTRLDQSCNCTCLAAARARERAVLGPYMVQHEILMVVAAPLLVLSRPFATFLWALPMRWRARFGSIPYRALANMWFAWTLHAAALRVWHIPRLCQATVTSEAVHTIQHLSFIVSALTFWWALLYGRQGRLGYGASVFYVFTTGLHSSVLGALLTFARVPWYPAYAESAKAWGLTALEDQQLAGFIMWVPRGCLYVLAGLAFFAAWLKESEWRFQRSYGLFLLLLGLIMTSCNNNVARAAADMTGRDPQPGRAAVREYGCAACHTTPGVAGADALVGPSLEHVANRAYIAGSLPNNPGNMIRWLSDPRHVNPHIAMPKTVPNEGEARNIAAYLYTLQ
jgi:hypothetical protein